MSEQKPARKATADIFANARASAAKPSAAVAAGMHNTITCGHCGAAREVGGSGGVADALVCRYCNTPFGGERA